MFLYYSNKSTYSDCVLFIYRVWRSYPDMCLQFSEFILHKYLLLNHDYYAWHLWITVCSHCLITLSLFNHCICPGNHCLLPLAYLHVYLCSLTSYLNRVTPIMTACLQLVFVWIYCTFLRCLLQTMYADAD